MSHSAWFCSEIPLSVSGGLVSQPHSVRTIGMAAGISFVFAAILSSSFGNVLRFAIVIASRLLSFLSGEVFFVYGWCANTRPGSFLRTDSFFTELHLRALAALPR